MGRTELSVLMATKVMLDLKDPQGHGDPRDSQVTLDKMDFVE